MTSRSVLDTSAVLALLFKEDGAKKALARGADGLISAVCYSEALAKSQDRQVPLETAKRVLDGFKLAIIPFDEAHAEAAAALRPRTRHLDISFADRACLATAAIANLPALTADREWVKAELDIEIVLIR